MKFIVSSLVLAAFVIPPAEAQTETELVGLETIVTAIEKLEGNSDAKCHASATRLENFMYGTPLSFEAREKKVVLQKAMILEAWKRASDAARSAGRSEVEASFMQAELDAVISEESLGDGGVRVTLDEGGDEVTLSGRDIRQYGSIAYALRAILAVQQEALLAPDLDLLPLGQEAIDVLKRSIDLRTLAALKLSDEAARASGEPEVTASSFETIWRTLSKTPPVAGELVMAQDPGEPGKVLRRIVDQKIASYAQYNQVRDALLYSNIRAFYARHPWPEDSAQIRATTQAFSEVVMTIAAEWILRAQEKAEMGGSPLIREAHVKAVYDETAPFEINAYEDIIFFRDLGPGKKLTIESYDADSFRDSGLHFLLLKQIIDTPGFPLQKDFDPFAAEYLAEGVAQIGVLTFRVAGMVAREQGDPVLGPSHVIAARDRIVSLMGQQLAAAPSQRSAPETKLVSSDSRIAVEKGRWFSDITTQTGIDYVHRSSDWLSRFMRSFLYSVHAPDAPNPRKGEAAHDAPPAFSGSGIAADDVDGDGLADILVVGGLGNRLYLNDGEGGFVDVTERAGLDFRGADGKPGEPRQPVIADFDNDGLQDILITYVNEDHRLYRSNGDGTFVDVSRRTGLGGKGLVGSAAAVLDFDRDGLLDIYITYYGNYVEGVGPNLARVNTNATPNKLFRNEGGFRFRDVSAGSGVENTGWSQAVAAVDLDGDGWQDLIVGNDFGVNSYYRNEGDGTFTDLAGELGTDIPTSAMNVGAADLNRDGHPDIYISNILTLVKDEKYVLPTEETRMKLDPEKLATMRIVASNHLFTSVSDEGVLERYVLSSEIDRADTGWAWDADFFDFDNDGDDDLYCVNGLNEYKFYDASFGVRTPEGEKTLVFSVNDEERNVLFVNEGGRLRVPAAESGLDFSGNSRAAAYLDFDHDGDLDVAVNNFNEPLRFFRNDAGSTAGHWIAVRLIGDPEVGSNRDAIGAVLRVHPEGGLPVWRTVQGGTGYLSHHPKEQHVGLGRAERADLEIVWPNGARQRVEGLRANGRYVIVQNDEAGSVETDESDLRSGS